MEPEFFSFARHSSLTLSASFYRATDNLKNQTIIYFHGGGLIWGDRDDLPKTYIDLFLRAGYHLLTVDYPLAPETALPEIYNCAVEAVEWFTHHSDTVLHLPTNDYNLFGRSAGAYLALLVGSDLKIEKKPHKIISFYGYSSIQEAFYLLPSNHYQTYPIIPRSLVNQLIQPNPLAKGTLETRYAIYLYARQTGRWLDLLLPDKKKQSQFSLTDNQLAALPPVFIAQSKTDQDVPFQQGENLSGKISSTKFVVIEKATHDFDSDSTNEKALSVYQEVIEWLNN
ncbi:alpha/beta hydrolase [Carnobacterium funditum]|uniref:alpha/beta hydrolase n=1 Tax=Carnobacterium funditum TaxID=2752 RepID=UPI000550C1D7|nr:alpha/beta hydrolase [Carnobacterium funditum]